MTETRESQHLLGSDMYSLDEYMGIVSAVNRTLVNEFKTSEPVASKTVLIMMALHAYLVQ